MERKGWTSQEIDIIKKYYPTEGIGVQKRLPDRTKNQIYGVAWHHGIKNESRKKRDKNSYPIKRYTSEELEYIKEHLDTDGAEKVAKDLDRTEAAIKSIACKIGINKEEKPWTDEEKEIVLKYFPVEGIKVIDRLEGRTKAAIYSEASHLGVSVGKRTRKSSNSTWTEEEDDIIREYYKSEGLAKCHELLPDRSKQAIIVRANRYLGIKK